jgi:hypothetical protein
MFEMAVPDQITNITSFFNQYPDLDITLSRAINELVNSYVITEKLAQSIFPELTKSCIPVQHTKWMYNSITRNEEVLPEVIEIFYTHIETSTTIPLDVLLQMSKNQSTPESVLEKMSYLEDPGLLIPSVIASNLDTPLWLLEDMFSRYNKKDTDSTFYSLFLEKLSSNPNISTKILENLVEKEDVHINRSIIINQNSTIEILRKIDYTSIEPFFLNNGYRYFRGKMDEELFRRLITLGDNTINKMSYYKDKLMKSEYIIDDALKGNTYAQRALLTIFREEYYSDFVKCLEKDNIKIKGLPTTMVASMLGWDGIINGL